MGNSSNQGENTINDQMNDFEMQKYLNQGLTQQQIKQIKSAFETYNPINGNIQLAKLKNSTEFSNQKDKIDNYLQNRDVMDFDEFFNMSKQMINDVIQRNPEIILDSNQIQSNCLLCPYAEDEKSR